MFGAYRLLLALMVLLKHFKQTEVFSGFAVWGFFMLSGFLITGILNTRYGYSHRGLLEFAINRALRLMPTYWLSVLMAALSIGLFAGTFSPTSINDAFHLPTSAWEWVPAFFIVGGSFLGVGRVAHSPSPSAWAVEVEILMYVLGAAWLSRSQANARRGTVYCLMLFPILWLAGKGLVANALEEAGRALTYSFLPAALLPFSIGALTWFHRNRYEFVRPSVIGMASATLALAICGLGVARGSVTMSFLLSLPIFAYFTIALSKLEGTTNAARVDTFLGHMSYPVYLLHWVCEYALLVAAQALGTYAVIRRAEVHGMPELTITGWWVLIATVLVTSALVAAWFEAPIERHRRQLATRISARIMKGKRSHDA